VFEHFAVIDLGSSGVGFAVGVLLLNAQVGDEVLQELDSLRLHTTYQNLATHLYVSVFESQLVAHVLLDY